MALALLKLIRIFCLPSLISLSLTRFFSLSPSLSLFSIAGESCFAFSDVTDRNDSSQFCVLTVKRSLRARDRQRGK